MNKPSRTVAITLFPEFEQLLAQYRAALERLDGKGTYARVTDSELIAIAARIQMRDTIEAAQHEGVPQ